MDTLVLAGDAEDVRQRFEACRTAGVDEPVAFLVSGQRDPRAVRAELEANDRSPGGVQLTAPGHATGAGPSCGLAPVAVQD